jgi:hypothetical protein
MRRNKRALHFANEPKTIVVVEAPICFSPALDLPHILMRNRARNIAEEQL